MLEIRAKARRLHSQCEGGLGLIIIDYLQLMRTDSRYDSRVTAVGELSRGLKILARELGVPVIALSQLSRAVETRRPRSRSCRTCASRGNLEQDSDLVMFIYRDEYYNEDSERPGEADLIIAKHRNGAVGQGHADLPEGVPEVHELRRRTLRAVSDEETTACAEEFPQIRDLRTRAGAGEPGCPLGICDGSGFVVDEETNTASDCRCRAARIAGATHAQPRGAHPQALPRRLLRAPAVSDIARDAPDQIRAVRRYVQRHRARTSTPGRGLWLRATSAPARRRSRCSSRRRRSTRAARSRSTRCRAC